MSKDGKGGDQDPGAGTATQIKIEVEGGEKVLTAEDVQNLVNQSKSVAQSSQKVANILKTVEKYETDPDTYLSNAEAAFGVMNLLIEKGVINEQGELIEKKDPSKEDDDKTKFKIPGAEDSTAKTIEIVKKAFMPDMEALGKRLDGLERGQSGLLRRSLKNDVLAKHPDFGDEDIARLLRITQEDTRKTIWEHAEDLDRGKKSGQATERATYAKEFGIDLEEFDQNKLKEQDAEGGGAAIIEGKQVMFASRAKKLGIKDAVTPGDATKEHFGVLDKAR